PGDESHDDHRDDSHGRSPPLVRDRADPGAIPRPDAMESSGGPFTADRHRHADGGLQGVPGASLPHRDLHESVAADEGQRLARWNVAVGPSTGHGPTAERTVPGTLEIRLPNRSTAWTAPSAPPGTGLHGGSSTDTSESSATAGPRSSSATPRARCAATGANTSRPWNVALGAGVRQKRGSESSTAATAGSASSAPRRSPLSGPT